MGTLFKILDGLVHLREAEPSCNYNASISIFISHIWKTLVKMEEEYWNNKKGS